jgi:hypothetical protein
MNARIQNGWRRVAFPCCVVLALALSGIVARAAQIYTLTDNNSSAQINPYTQAGMLNWSVQGNNQLNQQWFWYRTDGNPNASIDTISAPTVGTFDGTRGLTTTYANSQFSVRIDYLLSGGQTVAVSNTASSDIGETITINNKTASPLSFTFFQYSFFNLGGLSHDTVTLGKNLRGLFNDAYQTSGGVADLTETVTTPGAPFGEAAFAGGAGSTLAKLNNGTAADLNNVAGPVGAGQVTWALEWNFNIAAGSSVLISKDKSLSIVVPPPVPEPASLALLSMGLVVVALRKKYRFL